MNTTPLRHLTLALAAFLTLALSACGPAKPPKAADLTGPPSRLALDAYETVFSSAGETVTLAHYAFLSDGEKFRVEHDTAAGAVVIFDGTAHYQARLDGEADPASLSLLPAFRTAVASIDRMTYVGPEDVDGVPCWHFKWTAPGEDVELWLDRKQQFPRKVRTLLPNGNIREGVYRDLRKVPENFQALFNGRSLLRVVDLAA